MFLNYLNPGFTIRFINGGVCILAIRSKMFGRSQYEICCFTFYVNIVLGNFKNSSNDKSVPHGHLERLPLLKMSDGSELTSGRTGYIQTL